MKILEWDSNFFKFKVARMNPSENLEDELSHMKEENIKLAYFSSTNNDSKFIKRINDLGGELIVKKANLKLTKIPLTENEDKNIFSYSHNILTKNLLDLTYQAGILSRYKLDPKFKKDDWKKMYKIWIERSLNGEIADEVLVYKENNKELGFITLKKDGGNGEIGLLAVDSNHREKHIATKLMNALFAKAIQMGLRSISVATQEENVPAMKFYAKLGFKIEEIENIFHFWL